MGWGWALFAFVVFFFAALGAYGFFAAVREEYLRQRVARFVAAEDSRRALERL